MIVCRPHLPRCRWGLAPPRVNRHTVPLQSSANAIPCFPFFRPSPANPRDGRAYQSATECPNVGSELHVEFCLISIRGVLPQVTVQLERKTKGSPDS